MARLHPLAGASLALAAVLALAGVAGPAHAQSKRYPAPPKDADREAENHSHLWESALDPERKPYDELVRDGRRLLDDTTRPARDQATAALPKLDEAVARMPKDYRARAVRGRAYLVLNEWVKCAADLELADDAARADASERDAIELQLGICQGRAGKLADAERTLLHAVAVAPRGEQWMRLGEVRIALGKLDEAVDSLSAALEAHDGVETTIHWLLALAYDRARKSSLADDEARRAMVNDATFNMIQNPQYPWLRPGELEYMLGLARRAQPAQERDLASPELALLYFRKFLRIAGDTPWKKRAEEHVRELSAMTFPLALARTPQSTSVVETAPLVPLVQRAMPGLRACVAKLPGEAFGVAIIRAGARETGPDRVHYAVKTSGVTVRPILELDPITQDAETAATKCLRAAAERIPLPTPKERDTYYEVSFSVVAP